MLPEIEREIQMPISSIQSRLQQDCKAHSAGRPTDCFFLESELNLCRIHASKPDSCLSFPSLNDGGAGERNCPGHREFRKIMKALPPSRESAFIRNLKSPVKRPLIPGREWSAILMTLEKAGASRRYREAFILMNGRSENNAAAGRNDP
jgi:hypothetical protein